ncbi:methionine adenosyltransferase [Prosthecochloris sp. N3]|uniref:Methionine adenosyltransferase n=1 Tax=Prosthecochloris ethylica TaxID=2743976 RepID=A0ABR9XU46_9CHLB|nr:MULTISPECIES: methionine adenosyltransferase [Prosthecochloris]MBF0587017.1 methionine adenosyltransferase [Prosthecochloris ethylica]MBF0637387.1 methionine adenosyltransferase [Prosthecochloris ethylica]NUK48143.1 methionine adenosyltransferase [Prosthecochloris ethylica]RNA65283.1 methionine adenosyltransferase [Prosthecochloris sp. ZM_2]
MNKVRNISVETDSSLPIEQQQIELVERKGIAHPDTMCDSIMEEVCISLCREYKQRFGSILHHNIDKGMVVAGKSLPTPGGGRIIEPMKIIFGDRATYAHNSSVVPVGEIAEKAAKQWLRKHMRFIDPDEHVIYQNEIKPGSAELTDVFSRPTIGANDTSVGVGYAPLTETEQLVLALERYLNSAIFKHAYPETGKDIKVMGMRNGRNLTLTIAMAFVDRYIHNEAMYFERKEVIRDNITRFINCKQKTIEDVTVLINTLDDPSRGEGGMYLTVLGSSAESADSGQVGRGNRVNGLISFNRPQTLEAAAGKNPVNHVGKIYNVLSNQMARRIHKEIKGISGVTVYLCSQIGKPLDEPLTATAKLILEEGVDLQDVEKEVASVIHVELAYIQVFLAELALGNHPVC